jgi:pyrimidine deaminase RibD-like protein
VTTLLMPRAHVETVLADRIRAGEDLVAKAEIAESAGGQRDWLDLFARWRDDTRAELKGLYEGDDVPFEFEAVTSTIEHSSPRFTLPHTKRTLGLGIFALRSFVERLALAVEPGAIKPAAALSARSREVGITREEGDAAGTQDDRALMERAIALARQCQGEPGRVSPKVGAVVSRDGVLLGEAFRGELAPGDHAEFTLLEMKLGDDALAGATLFTTLEPCTVRHSPKIACAERIIERRIGRVVIGVLDPNDAIRGRGELRLRDAGIQIARFDPDLMAQVEELNRDFARLHVGARQLERTKAQTSDPADPEQVGPNGHRVGYTGAGDKIEWIPDEDNPGEARPLLLRRNDAQILATNNELWDKVWWNRHQIWRERIESGEERLTEAEDEVFERASEAAALIEEKYGRENLGCGDYEWGLLSGRMSALSWVLGAEWDESLDT